MKRIGNVCKTCKEVYTAPLSFRVSIPEEVLRINADVAMELVRADRRSVLHVIDTHLCFQNAAFISDKTATGISTLFAEIWSSVYCGFGAVLRFARLPSFMSAPLQHSVNKRVGVI